jgi:hypothetical protein
MIPLHVRQNHVIIHSRDKIWHEYNHVVCRAFYNPAFASEKKSVWDAVGLQWHRPIALQMAAPQIKCRPIRVMDLSFFAEIRSSCLEFNNAKQALTRRFLLFTITVCFFV